MRKTLIACLLALCSGAAAQTETSVYRPGVTPEGAVYFLPKTVLRFVVRVEKTSYTPGDFCRYAQRYLRLNDVKAEPSVTHRLIGLSMTTFGEADKAKGYAVKFNAKTSACNIALADDGTEVTVLEMSGAHTAPGGHLTTSGRLTLYGETPVTFMLDLDSKKADQNLTAELLVDDGWGGTVRLAALGSWLADPDARTLVVDLSDLSLEANGLTLGLSAKLAIAPGDPMDELAYTPTLLNDMSDIEVQEFLFSLLGEFNSMVYAPLTGSNMW